MRNHSALIIGLGILAAGIIFVCLVAFGLLGDEDRDVNAVPTPTPRVTPTPSPVKLPLNLPHPSSSGRI